MDFYWIKTSRIIKRIFSNYIWDLPNNENKIYLTFDDGPTPDITEWVLSELKKYNAKATFFCIGNNIQKYPEIFKKVVSDGHSIGNHTFNHLKGWKTATETYIENTALCESEIYNLKKENTTLFRPPYGRIKFSQSKLLKKKGYRIVLWDVLSADFDQTISEEKCLENVIKNTASGSIIIFHDSEKASKNMKYVLPKALAILSEKGFLFEAIE